MHNMLVTSVINTNCKTVKLREHPDEQSLPKCKNTVVVYRTIRSQVLGAVEGRSNAVQRPNVCWRTLRLSYGPPTRKRRIRRLL
jgi:hypothetical protein